MQLNYNEYLKGGIKTIESLATGNIPGAIINGIGATVGLFGNSNSASKAAAQQYKYNLALQQQSQQWNEYMYKNRYQMQREDLEKAGINALYGLGNAPSITSGTNSVGMPDMVGEQNNKFNQIMSLLDFGQNLSAKRAQTKLLENQAITENFNANLKSLEVIGKQLEVENLPKKIKLELEETRSRILKNMADTEEAYSSSKLKNAQTANEIASGGKIRRYEKWYRENRELGKIAEEMDALTASKNLFSKILGAGGTGWKVLLNK